ncbi:hypothetical protein D3C87_2113430 [compost metagenome]
MPQSFPARKMHLNRYAGCRTGTAGGAQRFFFISGKATGNADFANQPGHHLRLLLRTAKVVNQPVGQLLHAGGFHPFRM